MDKRKVIFSNRFEKEKLDDYSTNLETDNAIAPTFSEANDFLKFIQKNRRSIPSKERIADKDKFIKTVYELSNSFEIDADLIEFAESDYQSACKLLQTSDTGIRCTDLRGMVCKEQKPADPHSVDGRRYHGH